MIRSLIPHQFTDCNIVGEVEEWSLTTNNLVQRSVRIGQKWHYSSYVSLIYILVILVLKIVVSVNLIRHEVRLTLIYWSCAFALYISSHIRPNLRACMFSEPMTT